MEGAEKARGLERYIGLDIHKEYALVVGHGRKRAPGIDLQTVRQICLVEVGRRDRHHALCAEGRAASGGLQRRDAGAHGRVGSQPVSGRTARSRQSWFW